MTFPQRPEPLSPSPACNVVPKLLMTFLKLKKWIVLPMTALSGWIEGYSGNNTRQHWWPDVDSSIQRRICQALEDLELPERRERRSVRGQSLLRAFGITDWFSG